MRNQLIYGHVGGKGGGKIKIKSRHVDIDGEISVDGKPHGDRLGGSTGLFYSQYSNQLLSLCS